MATVLPFPSPPPLDESLGRATMRRVSLRLLPYLFVLYLLNYLDRTNVSIAALQMNRDLRFSDGAYGLGAGIFFIGYALFEVPSNIVLARVGARRWIARIMISWGIIATAMLFVRTPMQFYVARFLLGVAEAGFFPGIVYYLGQWFPTRERGRALSRFAIAIPLSGAIGNPLSAALLGLDGRMGLAGWQWLFLVEGLPSVLLGVTVLWWLTDRPEQAAWLPAEQREWLVARLAREDAAGGAAAPHGLPTLRVFAQPLVWLLALPYFLLCAIAYVFGFWAPTIFREALGASPGTVGLLLGGFSCAVAVVMLLVGASADRRGEHALHVAAGAAVAACGLAVTVLVATPAAIVVGLALLSVGTTGVLAAFWCLPGMVLRGRDAAVGIALVNAIGNTGGFVGPAAMGAIRDATGSPHSAYIVMLGCALGMLGAALLVRRHMARAPGGALRVAQAVAS